MEVNGEIVFGCWPWKFEMYLVVIDSDVRRDLL